MLAELAPASLLERASAPRAIVNSPIDGDSVGDQDQCEYNEHRGRRARTVTQALQPNNTKEDDRDRQDDAFYTDVPAVDREHDPSECEPECDLESWDPGNRNH